MAGKSHYIFDANFFISVHKAHPKPIIEAISGSVRDNDGVPHVTERITTEVDTLRYKDRKLVLDDIRENFEIDRVDEGDIEALERRLGGTHKAPQHPDLSLMVLADRLGKKGEAIIVSDDFKIHTSQRDHNLGFKVISPSAFLLEISNRSPNNVTRRSFRKLYRHVRRREIEYMLSRRDTYNIEPKLTWLVDNLMGSRSSRRKPSRPRIVPVSDDEEVDLEPVYRYIEGERVRKSKLRPFENILPHLDFLRETRGVDEEVSILIDHGEYNDALRVVRTASARLKRSLQEASLGTDRMDSLKVRQVYSHYLAHYYFLMALLNLNLGHLLFAEECLDTAGFCALITRDNDDIIKASYIKSLIYFNLEDYEEAREQFGTTERISRNLGHHDTEFKSLFGKSISFFLSGQKEEAEGAMRKVHRMVEEMGKESTVHLCQFADELLHFGRAEVAVAVYSEALESALEWGQTEDLEDIVSSLKRSSALLAEAGVSLDSELTHLIDKANDLCDACRETYFSEMSQLAEEEASRMKPLDDIVGKWTDGADVPPIYKNWMEVIKFVPMRESMDETDEDHTLVMAYNPDIGVLGIYLKGKEYHSTVERYQVRLRDSGVFKVLDAPDRYKRRYGIRGLVGTKTGSDVELKHIMSLPFIV